MSPTNSDLVLHDDDDDEYGDDLEVVEAEPTVEEVAAEITRVNDEVAALVQRAAEVAAEQVDDHEASGQALVPSATTAEAAKRNLATLRVKATKKQQALRKIQDEIRERSRDMEGLLRKQMDLAMGALAPLQRYMERLEEGIWMVNLYLGRDEEIHLLADGEPADAKIPVVIRQLVLAMDEESAIGAEHGGIDAREIEEFDKWIVADPAHVAQVIPDPKSVVAIIPRRQHRDYGDPWMQKAMDEQNRQTYFLIRNGGKLYRTVTEFDVGERLVPTAEEFTSFFYEEKRGEHGKHRIPIEPGTLAWERAEEAADARKRHFMRVGLILQGLADRTTVFHPQPDGGINFLDYEHGGRTWRFLTDAEMALTTGRKPFREWLKERNSHLRVGMRVVCGFPSRYYSRHDSFKSRIWPNGAEYPPDATLLTVEDQDGSAFIIRYKRTDMIYSGYRIHEAKQRASCRIYADDSFVIPFDLVTVEEMEEYLTARLDRHAYEDMFPVLKAAIQAKKDEADQEAPFRTMLAGVLARENGVEVAEAEEMLGDLIDWFKLANKNHRPLVGDEKSQAHAVRMIVAEHARRLVAKQSDSGVVAKIRAEQPSAVLIGRKRDGKYVVVVPENEDNVFVSEHEYGARGTRSGAPKRWRLMPALARRSRWHVAYEAERFAAWDFGATLSQHLTGPEFDAHLASLRSAAGAGVVAIAYRPEKREWHVWRYESANEIDAEHPLSGAHAKFVVEHEEASWTRRGGEAALGRLHPSSHGGWVDQVKPWDTRPVSGKSQWRRADRNLFKVAYHDPALDRAVEEQKSEWREHEERVRAMESEARKLLNSIVAQWMERQERSLFEEFLAEYLDASLWEGHRKSMDPALFRYPHNHTREVTRFASLRYERRPAGDALRSVIYYAVERGIDLGGLTVAEALAEHYPPVEWFGEPHVDRYTTVKDGVSVPVTEVEQFPTADEVPEDLLDLRFVRPEPEPSDEVEYFEDWADD